MNGAIKEKKKGEEKIVNKITRCTYVYTYTVQSAYPTQKHNDNMKNKK